jgi:polysaccharide export outer membrane protein
LISGAVLVLLALLPGARPLAAQTDPAVAAADADAIHPGDIVRLSVLRDKDLSGEFEVNQFGTVVLPLVGEYDVTRQTQKGLRDLVIRDLQQIRFAKDIEVVVLRRVRVVGEVNEPGVYPLDPTMSIADAVAMAKGRTQFAREGEVLLRRGGKVVTTDLLLDERVGDSPVRSGDEIFIPRRGWFDRNAASVIGGASALVGVLVTLIATGE